MNLKLNLYNLFRDKRGRQEKAITGRHVNRFCKAIRVTNFRHFVIS